MNRQNQWMNEPFTFFASPTISQCPAKILNPLKISLYIWLFTISWHKHKISSNKENDEEIKSTNQQNKPNPDHRIISNNINQKPKSWKWIRKTIWWITKKLKQNQLRESPQKGSGPCFEQCNFGLQLQSTRVAFKSWWRTPIWHTAFSFTNYCAEFD